MNLGVALLFGPRPSTVSCEFLTALIEVSTNLHQGFACGLLDGYGFQSVGVADAAKAQDVLRHERADLVITEQRLPRGDGWQWLHALRVEYLDLPVLLYTATSPVRPADARFAFDAVLLKPATAAELLTCVMRLIATPAGR